MSDEKRYIYSWEQIAQIRQGRINDLLCECIRQVDLESQLRAVCRYLRGEVERLEAELSFMQIQRDARPKIPVSINEVYYE